MGRLFVPVVSSFPLAPAAYCLAWAGFFHLDDFSVVLLVAGGHRAMLTDSAPVCAINVSKQPALKS